MPRLFAVLLVLIVLAGCSHTSPPVAHAAVPVSGDSARLKREIRLTGLIEAVHSSKILVPQIYGPGGPLTLTHLITSGSSVKQGDIIATFDATAQIDSARDAQAKYDDLGHQVDQKRAQNSADAAKRASDLKQAEGDLQKAELELKKGPTLPEIDRLKNDDKIDIARKHV